MTSKKSPLKVISENVTKLFKNRLWIILEIIAGLPCQLAFNYYLAFSDIVKEVRVSCNSEDIGITLTTFGESFNGLIYPKGLSKISSCMTEYKQVNKRAKMRFEV
jgi:hypothetical protein